MLTVSVLDDNRYLECSCGYSGIMNKVPQVAYFGEPIFDEDFYECPVCRNHIYPFELEWEFA